MKNRQITFRRFCERCNEMFKPDTKHTYICDKCSRNKMIIRKGDS